MAKKVAAVKAKAKAGNAAKAKAKDAAKSNAKAAEKAGKAAKRLQQDAASKADDKKRAAAKKAAAVKENLHKKLKRAEKAALAGIPDELQHTGVEKMKLSNMRSAQRLAAHVLRSKKRLFRAQGRAFMRLQRSAGGTAA